MKVIIAGSRDIPRYWVKNKLFNLENFIPVDEVVCGTARGPDTYGKEWATSLEIPTVDFQPSWQEYGKRAGIQRNGEMADYADMLIAFWDGKSRGTAHMISCMERRNKDYMVFYYNDYQEG